MSFQSISGAWPGHCTEKNVGQICYKLARLLGSIINVCFGQELVILYMLFLDSEDDDTLLREAGMVMEKKISLKTWKKRWNNRNRWNNRGLFFPAVPPSWHYLLILGWCFFVLIRQIILLQSTHWLPVRALKIENDTVSFAVWSGKWIVSRYFKQEDCIQGSVAELNDGDPLHCPTPRWE